MSKSVKVDIYDFLLSMDYGLCHGPIDKLNAIWIKDRRAYCGELTGGNPETLVIDRNELFGGDKKEGGVSGRIEVYTGTSDQVSSEELASRVDRTGATMPGYRGLVHLFFRGADGTGKGFRWGTNNPYLPPMKANVTRLPADLSETYKVIPAAIGVNVAGELMPFNHSGDDHCTNDMSILPTANPANIIYECLINPEWGKGESPSNVDTASFEAVAFTLFSELFGLSLVWVAQETIENFIQLVLDHIKGMLFVNPSNGLWTLKLLRDDYDIGDCAVLNQTNSKLKNPKRRLWGETVNEIIVEWTDPNTEETATVSAHNLGNIATQGGMVPDTRSYFGIRNRFLAQMVANRDVLEASYPLFAAQIECDRTVRNDDGSAIKPGDVVNLQWAEEGIATMACRVMNVEYGEVGSRKQTLDVIEDIYAADQTKYAIVSDGGSLLDTSDPDPANVIAANILTAPAPLLLQNGLNTSYEAYPDVLAMLLATAAEGTIGIEANTTITLANGSTAIGSVSNFRPVGSGLLTEALVPEVRSTLPGGLVTALFDGLESAGKLILLGSNDEASEIMMLDTLDGEDWIVVRGVWDTVPKDWPIGQRAFELPTSIGFMDSVTRADGETVAYRFLTRTREGLLAYASASQYTQTFTDRPYLPFRPANCELDGTGFAGVNYSGGGAPTDIEVTWATRNRLLEDATIPDWDDTAITPEAGQTTVLRVYTQAGVFSHEIDGLTGNSYTMAVSELAPVDRGTIQFVSERDGLRSLQGIRIPFNVQSFASGGSGYGNSYGENYGSPS